MNYLFIVITVGWLSTLTALATFTYKEMTRHNAEHQVVSSSEKKCGGNCQNCPCKQ